MTWTSWVVFCIFSALSLLGLIELHEPGLLLRLLRNIREMRYQNDKEVDQEIAILKRTVKKTKGMERFKAQVWLLFGVGAGKLADWIRGET